MKVLSRCMQRCKVDGHRIRAAGNSDCEPNLSNDRMCALSATSTDIEVLDGDSFLLNNSTGGAVCSAIGVVWKPRHNGNVKRCGLIPPSMRWSSTADLSSSVVFWGDGTTIYLIARVRWGCWWLSCIRLPIGAHIWLLRLLLEQAQQKWQVFISLLLGVVPKARCSPIYCNTAADARYRTEYVSVWLRHIHSGAWFWEICPGLNTPFQEFFLQR